MAVITAISSPQSPSKCPPPSPRTSGTSSPALAGSASRCSTSGASPELARTPCCQPRSCSGTLRAPRRLRYKVISGEVSGVEVGYRCSPKSCHFDGPAAIMYRLPPAFGRCRARTCASAMSRTSTHSVLHIPVSIRFILDPPCRREHTSGLPTRRCPAGASPRCSTTCVPTCSSAPPASTRAGTGRTHMVG